MKIQTWCRSIKPHAAATPQQREQYYADDRKCPAGKTEGSTGHNSRRLCKGRREERGLPSTVTLAVRARCADVERRSESDNQSCLQGFRATVHPVHKESSKCQWHLFATFRVRLCARGIIGFKGTRLPFESTNGFISALYSCRVA